LSELLDEVLDGREQFKGVTIKSLRSLLETQLTALAVDNQAVQPLAAAPQPGPSAATRTRPRKDSSSKENEHHGTSDDDGGGKKKKKKKKTTTKRKSDEGKKEKTDRKGKNRSKRDKNEEETEEEEDLSIERPKKRSRQALATAPSMIILDDWFDGDGPSRDDWTSTTILRDQQHFAKAVALLSSQTSALE